jgi:hypothetical protein
MVTLDVYIVGLQTALQNRALGFSQQMLFDQFPFPTFHLRDAIESALAGLMIALDKRTERLGSNKQENDKKNTQLPPWIQISDFAPS